MRSLLLAVALAAAAACEDQARPPPLTSELVMRAIATNRNAGSVHVEVDLRRVSDPFWRSYGLADDERLVFEAEGVETQPDVVESENAGIYYYAEIFLQDLTSPIRIRLERAFDASAPDTQIVLPTAFEITPPVFFQEISRSQGLMTITWQPTDPTPMHWTISADCVEVDAPYMELLGGALVEDTGELILSVTAVPGQEGATCVVSLVFSRLREGIPDPAFAPRSEIRGSYERPADFYSTP